MKILFVHHRYHTNLFNWFRGFQENGHDVRLLVYKPDKLSESDLPESTYLKPSKWSSLKMKRNSRTRGDGVDSFSPYYYPSFKLLYNYFKSERPDLVVIRPAFSRYAYMVLLCSLLFSSKKVFYSQIRIHKAYSKYKLYVFNLGMWILNAHWISPCLGDKEKYPSAPKRMVYFPFAMPLLSQRVKPFVETSEVRVLSVAKYFKSKNPKLVLDVFLELCKDHENIKLTICGSGDESGDYFQEMNKKVLESDFKDRIQLLINEPYNKVQNLYKTHDIFVLPSKHDPAAITNLEAMAHGMPVVCSINNGTANYTEHGVNGFIIDPLNPQELRRCFEKMIREPKLVVRMGENSLLSLNSNHDPKKITSQLLLQIA